MDKFIPAGLMPLKFIGGAHFGLRKITTAPVFLHGGGWLGPDCSQLVGDLPNYWKNGGSCEGFFSGMQPICQYWPSLSLSM